MRCYIVHIRAVVYVIANIIVLFGFLSMLFLVGELHADETNKEQLQVQTIVDIIHKRPDFIIASDNNKYRVDDGTVIYDTKGRQIDLLFLAFPCTAEIVFEGPDRKHFNAKQIIVIELSRDASNEWSPPTPE